MARAHLLTRFALVAFVAWGPLAGCGSRGSDAETTPSTEEAAAAFDDRGFLEGCHQGCGADDPLCEQFCACSLEQIHADPSLARAVVEASAADADAATVESVQTRFLGACGEPFYQHHFVSGCAATCIDDGNAQESCDTYCGCLYHALRARHPGPDGLALLSRTFGSDHLSSEARAEIEAVRSVCGL